LAQSKSWCELFEHSTTFQLSTASEKVETMHLRRKCFVVTAVTCDRSQSNKRSINDVNCSGLKTSDL